MKQFIENVMNKMAKDFSNHDSEESSPLNHLYEKLAAYGALRGEYRGKGRPGGLRRNRNTEPCTEDGPGKSKGRGKGKGKNRKSKKTLKIRKERKF